MATICASQKQGEEAKEEMAAVCLTSCFMSLDRTAGNWDENAGKPQARTHAPLLPPLLLSFSIPYLIQNEITN